MTPLSSGGDVPFQTRSALSDPFSPIMARNAPRDTAHPKTTSPPEGARWPSASERDGRKSSDARAGNVQVTTRLKCIHVSDTRGSDH